MSKTAKINQIKTLLSKSEAKGKDLIYIQANSKDEAVLYAEIPNGRESSLSIQVTSKEAAIALLKIMQQ